MINFDYYNPTKIIFGKDTEKKVGKLVSKYGRNVLLHYGGGSIKKNGVYDSVIESLQKEKCNIVELGGVVPNPRLDMVLNGIEICKKNNIDIIIAVGGGSAIDSAKAIAVGVYSDNVWEYFMDSSKKIEKALPLGVILTMPATGSENSDSCVITNELGGHKRSITSNLIRPAFAILNPEISFSMPKYQIACGVSDIMAHLMERYFTNTKFVDYTDKLLEASMKCVMENALLAMENPLDYNCRAEIMWVGTIAHNGLLDTGRVDDWASHKIEHELSAIYDIAHGAGLSIVFPAYLKFVTNHDIDRMVQFATKVMKVEISHDDKKAVAREGIKKLENWYKQLGLPIRLAEVELEKANFKYMAKNAFVNRKNLGNYVKLTEADVVKIFELAKI